MSGFDPYHQWFGIAPSEQPANHYRLLGLKEFESSSQAIEEAVASRAEFLQTMSMGEHVGDAQKILNEVAKARICLINADKKERYDSALRKHQQEAKQAKSGEQPIPLAIPIGDNIDEQEALGELQRSLGNSKRTESHSQPQTQAHPSELVPGKSKSALTWAIVGVTLIVGAVVFLLTQLGKGPPEKTQARLRDPKLVTPDPLPPAEKEIAAIVAPVSDQPSKDSQSPKPKADSPPESAIPKGKINWLSPFKIHQQLGNSADVITSGKLCEAANCVFQINKEKLETWDTTVNGVKFEGKIAFAGDGSQQDLAAKLSSGDSEYKKLLSQSSFSDIKLDPTANTRKLILGNGKLTPSAPHLIQLWYYDDRPEYTERSIVLVDENLKPQKLNDQFAVGLFKPDASGSISVEIKTNGDFGAHITAYQIRNIAGLDANNVVSSLRKANNNFVALATKKKTTPVKPKGPKPNAAKPKPKPKTVAKKRPLKYPVNPLEFFPTAVNLPTTSVNSRSRIADVFCPNNMAVKLELAFLDEWTRSGAKFTLKKQEASNRKWQVHHTAGSSPSNVIAEFSLDSYGLNFNWLPAATESPKSGELRNGIITLTAGKQSKQCALRQQTTLARLTLDPKKYTLKKKVPILNAPPASALKFTPEKFPKHLEIETFDITTAEKSEPAYIYFSPAAKALPRPRLRLEVEGRMRGDQFEVSAQLQGSSFQTPTRYKPIKRESDLVRHFEELESTIRLVRARQEKAGKNDKPKFQPLIAELSNTLKRHRKAIQALPNAPLRFRFFYEFETKRIGVAGSNYQNYHDRRYLPTTKEFREQRLVYDIDFKKLTKNQKYRVDLSSELKAFDRVGYFIELKPQNGPLKAIFVSFDAFSDNPLVFGLPTPQLGSFQKQVNNLYVWSNKHAGLVKPDQMKTGFLEFIPFNYSPENKPKLPGASDKLHDIADNPSQSGDYGCMQVHDLQTQTTIFNLSHWSAVPKMDAGIGPQPKSNKPRYSPDWTFAENGPTYSMIRLRVYVRPTTQLAK